MALLKSIRRSDGQQVARGVEIYRSDAGGVFGVLLDSLLVLRIPDRHDPITASSDKRAVHWMEPKTIHWVCNIHTIHKISMTFKCILETKQKKINIKNKLKK